jgi:hypothetical protein
MQKYNSYKVYKLVIINNITFNKLNKKLERVKPLDFCQKNQTSDNNV